MLCNEKLTNELSEYISVRVRINKLFRTHTGFCVLECYGKMKFIRFRAYYVPSEVSSRNTKCVFWRFNGVASLFENVSFHFLLVIHIVRYK